MGIERDDGVERQARVDRMIDEFRRAQSRRRGETKDSVVVEPKPEANRQAPATGSAGS